MGAAIIILILPFMLFIAALLLGVASELSWSTALAVAVAILIAGAAFGAFLKLERDEEEEIETELGENIEDENLD